MSETVTMPISIRAATDTDRAAIRRVHLDAFEHADEADLVDALRDGGHVLVSLVAEVDADVVGHILMTRMKIITDGPAFDAVSLAPMAVRSTLQGRGIGSELVEQALDRCRELGEQIVIVLGHPEYYPRFGFRSELTQDLESPWTGSDAFMAIELVDGALESVRGRVSYAAPFGID